MQKNITKSLDRMDAERWLKQMGDWGRILKAFSDSGKMLTEKELEDLGVALDRGGDLSGCEQSLLVRLNSLPVWDQGERCARLLQSGFPIPDAYVEFFDKFGLMKWKRPIFK
jgi:hypothetical protein